MLSENLNIPRQLFFLKNVHFNIRPEDGAVFQQSLLIKVKTNGKNEGNCTQTKFIKKWEKVMPVRL